MTYPTYESVTDPDATAGVAKALGHPARLQIVELLAHQEQCRGAELFAELPLAQSTVSEHLKILREAGLVSASRVGAGVVYCLRYEALDSFASYIAGIAGLVSSADCPPVDSGEGACS